MSSFDDCITSLRAIHEAHPDLSLGEIIQVACDRAKQRANTNIVDLPDKQLATALQSYGAIEQQARAEDSARQARLSRLDDKTRAHQLRENNRRG